MRPLTADDRHKILFVMQDETDLSPFFFLVFDSPFYKSIMEVLVEANLVGRALHNHIKSKFSGNWMNAMKHFEIQARKRVMKIQN